MAVRIVTGTGDCPHAETKNPQLWLRVFLSARRTLFYPNKNYLITAIVPLTVCLIPFRSIKSNL